MNRSASEFEGLKLGSGEGWVALEDFGGVVREVGGGAEAAGRKNFS